jgi:hypothetical protein
MPRPPSEPEQLEAEIPRVSWDLVAPEFIDAWGQGEHLVILGKTGRGKTTFAFDVLQRRYEQAWANVCVFVTKKRDDTTAKLKWDTIKAWPPDFVQRKGPIPRPDRQPHSRLVLWPPYTDASSYPRDVRPTFLEALDEIMEEGNWTLFLDEASYMVESLRLRTSMDEFFTQSRSNGITLVAGSQRPVWVSRSMLSQHCWVACFRIGDSDDAIRAGEVLGNKKRYTPVILNLGPHEFLLVNTVNDRAVISQIGT